MKFYRAELETPNFTFEAYGKTKSDAIDNLVGGCIIHCNQYKVSWDYFKKAYFDKDEMEDLVYEVRFDSPLRDKQLIIRSHYAEQLGTP